MGDVERGKRAILRKNMNDMCNARVLEEIVE